MLKRFSKRFIFFEDDSRLILFHIHNIFIINHKLSNIKSSFIFLLKYVSPIFLPMFSHTCFSGFV